MSRPSINLFFESLWPVFSVCRRPSGATISQEFYYFPHFRRIKTRFIAIFLEAKQTRD